MSTRRRKTHCEAREFLTSKGIDFRQDFHALPSAAVDLISFAAKSAGYRKRRDAPGSRARMYFQFLARKRGC